MLRVTTILIFLVLATVLQFFLSRTRNKLIGWVLPVILGGGGLILSIYHTRILVALSFYVNVETPWDAIGILGIVLLFLINSFVCLIPAAGLTLIHIKLAYKKVQ